MASIFKRDGRSKYLIKYKAADGNWKTVTGCPDLESTRRLAKKLESESEAKA